MTTGGWHGGYVEGDGYVTPYLQATGVFPSVNSTSFYEGPYLQSYASGYKIGYLGMYMEPTTGIIGPNVEMYPEYYVYEGYLTGLRDRNNGYLAAYN